MKFENKNFSFEVSSEDTIVNAINNLPKGKASVLTETIDAYYPKLT